MQKILVAGPTFPDVIERLKRYFEVDWNNREAHPRGRARPAPGGEDFRGTNPEQLFATAI
nr:hypothetical protein [Paraburkholderia susongensis]